MPKRLRLTREQRKDLRETYRANIDATFNRIQAALHPEEHMTLALGRLERANNYVDRALFYIDQLATDQENLDSLKKDVAAWAMVLTEIDDFETMADAKSRLKRVRNALDNPVWES